MSDSNVSITQTQDEISQDSYVQSICSNSCSILSFHPAEEEYLEIDDIHEENVIKYENTYRMESKNPFNEHKAMTVVKNEIEKYLDENTKYDPNQAIKICEAMSLNIRNNICDMNFERYKIVCIVQIVEKKNQGVLSVAKLLRDLKKDKYVESKFENTNLMAAVMVGALYYE